MALTVVKALMPSISDGFGVLLASGFIGGHGTAAAVGSTLDTLGWAEGTDIGLTFATIGIRRPWFTRCWSESRRLNGMCRRSRAHTNGRVHTM